MTVPRAQVSTHRGRVVLKLSADKLPVSNDRMLKFIFSNDLYDLHDLYDPMIYMKYIEDIIVYFDS